MEWIVKVFVFWFEHCFSITDNFLLNLIILSVLTTIAYVAAFRIVGNHKADLGYNSRLMSIAHWIIRIFIFIASSLVVAAISWFVGLFI